MVFVMLLNVYARTRNGVLYYTCQRNVMRQHATHTTSYYVIESLRILHNTKLHNGNLLHVTYIILRNALKDDVAYCTKLSNEI